MGRSEDDLRPETLQMRSEAIVEGLKKAFGQGLDPKHVAILHAFSPREHRDMLMVYLGIKPAAVFLNNAFKIYHQGDDELDYLAQLPKERDTGVKTRYSAFNKNIWNPVRAKEVMKAHPDLYSVAEREARATLEVLDPDNIEFGDFIHNISSVRVRQPLSMRVLSGILNGYPREAAEFFCQNRITLLNNIAAILDEADRLKIAYYMEDDSISIGTVGGSEKNRAELLRLADLVDFDDKHTLSLIAATRLADVPGYQYITMEGLTTDHEEKIRRAYDDSKLEEKLAQLLPSL